jgi:hypothetical protein
MQLDSGPPKSTIILAAPPIYFFVSLRASWKGIVVNETIKIEIFDERRTKRKAIS